MKIKFCGLVREQDVDAAVELGVDAIGLMFYPQSSRFIRVEEAKILRARIPASIAAVGLFVNAPRATVQAHCDALGLDILQFHGDESPEDLLGWNIPIWRAVRVQGADDVAKAAQRYPMASRLVLDAHVESYGGGGQAFDWNLVQQAHGLRDKLILAGGLTPQNVCAGIKAVRPSMVDVSSGIQGQHPREKDLVKMREFVRSVSDCRE